MKTEQSYSGRGLAPRKKKQIIDTFRETRSCRRTALLCDTTRGTVSRIVKKCGEQVKQPHRTGQNITRLVAELYPTHSTGELAEKLGVSTSYITKVRRRLGVAHTPECLERIKAKCSQNIGSSPEQVIRRTETRKKTVRREYRKMFGGERQRTKIHLTMMPLKTRMAIRALSRLYGYLYEIDSYTVYYDENTKRRPLDKGKGNEKFYEEKYKISFEPLNP